MSNKRDYSDIINIKHWNPKKHPRMTVQNRAAQFHPFDFSGQTKIDRDIADSRLNETGGYDKGYEFDKDNSVIE